MVPLGDVGGLQVASRVQELEHVLAIADPGGFGPLHAQFQDRKRRVLPDLGVHLAPAVAHEGIGHRLIQGRTLVVADPRRRRQAPADDLGRRLWQTAQGRMEAALPVPVIAVAHGGAYFAAAGETPRCWLMSQSAAPLTANISGTAARLITTQPALAASTPETAAAV